MGDRGHLRLDGEGCLPAGHSKLLGLPVAITIVHRPGGDRKQEQAIALRVVDADFTDADELLAAAREIHGWRRIDAILGLTELSLYPVSVVATELGARGNSPATLRYTQDKAAMRQRLADCGVSTTAHRVCADVAEAAEFARDCPNGMILKPVDGNGGTGVFLVREPSALAAGWTWTAASAGAWAWEAKAKRRPRVLAEEYLTGREFSVETLSTDGKHRVLAVTAKHTTGPPYFVETGHDVPAVLPAAHHTAVTGTALDALDAIGYTWGPAHTEVMLSEDGERATIIEINARQGGDQIWEMVELVTGGDMIIGSVLTLAHGSPPPALAIRSGGAAIRYLTPNPGRVISVEGLVDALAVEGVLRVSDLCRPGDIVKPLGDSWNRTGYVLTAAASTSAAAAAAEVAASHLRIHTVAVGSTTGGLDAR